MTEPTPPDWNHLPHDPEQFFSLDPGYDRKTLKRAYNRLLRQYKPEKFPEEFQKLRAAFEQLDNDLRYGTTTHRHVEPTAYTWTAEPQAAAAGSQSAESSAPVVVPLYKRVLTDSPETLYAELKQKQDQRTPFDYFAMSILVDTLPDRRPLSFVKCLLQGLKQYPSEPGLLSLLYRQLREPVLPDRIPGLLKAISKVVRTDRFYALTEPLWDELIRSIPFPKFQTLLEECEQNLRDFRVEGRVAFYLHLLRPAMFRAPEEWVDEAFSFIESNSRELAPWLEFELELLGMLRVYRDSRDDLLALHPLWKHVDRAIRAYSLKDPVEFDQTFIACQVHLASNPDELMQAVPFPDENDAIPSTVFLWQLLSGEVRERTGVGYSETALDFDNNDDRRKLLSRSRSLLRLIDARTNLSLRGRLWNFLAYVYGLMIIGGSYVLIFFSLLGVAEFFSLSSGTGVVIAIVGAAAGWPFNKLLESIWTKFCVSSAFRLYNTIWRSELHQFFGRTRMTMSDFIISLGELPEDTSEFTGFVRNFAMSDESLEFYSSAQDFLG